MPEFTIHATVSLRVNFAIQHLEAATQAAQSAYKVEQANATAEFGSWFDEMLLWVPVSVVMAAAALEAAANELIQNILDDAQRTIPGLSLMESQKEQLMKIKAVRRGNATDRYFKVARLFDKAPDKTSCPWHDAKRLGKFRNYFMHFKPSWDKDDIHNSMLVEALKNKIPIAAAYNNGKFLFPYGFMTYGCAKWAVKTVLIFSSEFLSKDCVHACRISRRLAG